MKTIKNAVIVITGLMAVNGVSFSMQYDSVSSCSTNIIQKEVIGTGGVTKEIIGTGGIIKEVIGTGGITKEIIGTGGKPDYDYIIVKTCTKEVIGTGG